MWAIYEVSPAPWGDDYRFVDSFDTEGDAEKVIICLEGVNVNFKAYKIIHWGFAKYPFRRTKGY